MFSLPATNARLVELENVTNWPINASVGRTARLEYDDRDIWLIEWDGRTHLGNLHADLQSEEQRTRVLELLKRWRGE